MGSTSHNYDIKNGIGKYGGMVLRKGSQHHAEESCFSAAIRAKQAKYITIVGIAADTF